MSDLDTYLQLFDLKPGASKQDLKQAYKRLAKQWHPDRFVNEPANTRIAEEKIKIINIAYETLQAHYDDSARLTSSGGTATTIRTSKVKHQVSFNKAKFFAKSGQYREAAEELSNAIRIDPKFAEAYQFRSLLFSKLGFEHRSASDLKRAKELGFKTTDLDSEVAEIFGKKSTSRNTQTPSRKNQKTEQKPSEEKTVNIPKSTAQISFDLVFAEISEPIHSVAISPNHKFLAIGKTNGDIDLWNYKSRKQFYSLKGHSAGITHLIFSDDNQFLFSSSCDGTVNLWSFNNGSLVKSMAICSQGVAAFDLCYSRRFIVTAGADGTGQVWDFQKNCQIKQLIRHKTAVSSIILNSTSDSAIYGADDGAVCLCYVSRDGSITNLNGHNQPVRALAFSSAKQHFASSSLAGEVSLWKYPHREPQQNFQSCHQSVNALAFCHGGQILCGSDRNGQLIVWDIDSGASLHTTEAHAAGTSKLISLSDEVILSVGSDGIIKLWQVLLNI